NSKLDFFYSYKYNPSFELHSSLKGKTYRNENINLQYQQFKSTNKFKFSFSPDFSITPIVGGIYDYKFSNEDPGIIYGIQLDGYNLNKKTNTSVKADYNSYFYDYKERKNRRHQLNFNYFTKFSSVASDSLYAGYSNKINNEYFISTLNNGLDNKDNIAIEKIQIEEITFSNDLKVKIFSNLILRNKTQFKKRDFSQKRENEINRRKENQFFNRLNFQLTGKKLFWNFGILNSLQINDFSQNISDNNNIQIAFNNSLRYIINQKQNLRWTFSYSKYEYNTPDSEKNFDDRDEIRFYNFIKYKYKINQHLHWTAYSGLKYFHQVFIYSQKSNLNKKERVAEAGTNVLYKLSNFRNTFGGIISTYYLTYDFDDQSNMINRKLTLCDTLRYKIFPETHLNFIAKYEIEELGNLDWNKFVEQITRKNHYNYYIAYFLHKLTNLISIKPGISYIVRNDFAYSPEKKRIRKYRSESYWLETIWKFSKHGYVSGKINKFLYKNSNTDWK
ncbi:MAG: hypothetical protein KAR38_11310, partial [Calditrichia bacterium]|nr:hypothetical protein [Calditrichia bacterium]